MENNKPNDKTDNCCTNQEYESVPRNVVHVKTKPLRPHSKQQEKYQTNHDQDQVEVHLHGVLLSNEHVETSCTDSLLNTDFNLLWFLSLLAVDIAVHIFGGLNFLQYFQLHQGKAELHRVLNFLEVIEFADLLNLFAHGQDLVLVSEDSEMQISAFMVLCSICSLHFLALGSFELLIKHSLAHLHVLIEEFDNFLSF